MESTTTMAISIPSTVPPPTVPPSTVPPPTDTSFTSPVSILPLIISLATLVTIIITACIIYRKRQNKRSQELARQLRVTERKIDAIGNLKAKKEQELLGLAKRKAEYIPPTTAPCSSATSLESHTNIGRELEVRFVPSTQIKEEEELTNSSMDYDLKLCEASINLNHPPSSSAPSTYTNPQSNQEGEEVDGSSSCYTSSYPDSSINMAAGTARTAKVDTSMAVECDTIPSASSLSTVIGTVLSQPQMPRSQSEHRHMHKLSKKQMTNPKRRSGLPTWNQVVQPYSHIVRNLRYTSKYKPPHSTDNPTAGTSARLPIAGGASWGSTLPSNAYTTINGPTSIINSYFEAGQSYSGSRTVSSTRREEGSGRPNTPVSSVTDLTTDTDGEKEKWV